MSITKETVQAHLKDPAIFLQGLFHLKKKFKRLFLLIRLFFRTS